MKAENVPNVTTPSYMFFRNKKSVNYKESKLKTTFQVFEPFQNERDSMNKLRSIVAPPAKPKKSVKIDSPKFKQFVIVQRTDHSKDKSKYEDYLMDKELIKSNFIKQKSTSSESQNTNLDNKQLIASDLIKRRLKRRNSSLPTKKTELWPFEYSKYHRNPFYSFSKSLKRTFFTPNNTNFAQNDILDADKAKDYILKKNTYIPTYYIQRRDTRKKESNRSSNHSLTVKLIELEDNFLKLSDLIS